MFATVVAVNQNIYSQYKHIHVISQNLSASWQYSIIKLLRKIYSGM